MIPISRAPKRFVAALNNHRNLRNYHVTLGTFKQSNDGGRNLSTLPSRVEFAEPAAANYIKFSNDYDAKLHQYLDLQIASKWWTGKPPLDCTYINKTAHSLPQVSLNPQTCTRESLQLYFDNTWTLTESLFTCLKGEEAFMVPPLHNLRHPLIFYYGHPAALYVNKLRVAGLLKEPINAYFEVIFETGVDEMSWDDMSKNKMSWPSVAEVHAYRKKVYETVSNLISNMTDEECANINQDSPWWSMVLSFEHERIHIETSSVLINELPIKYVQHPKHVMPPYYPLKESVTRSPTVTIDYPKNDLIEVSSQTVVLGKPKNFPSFGWDNEYGSRTYTVPAFKASQYKITNGEYLEFVKDGGYSRPELWSKTGWEWRAFRNAKWPTFWQNVGPQGMHYYDLRLLFDIVPMQWDWPVTVNFHESHAFATWKSLKTGTNIRVMTELEHHAIRDEAQKVHKAEETGHIVDPVIDYPPTDSMANQVGINANLSYSSMSPVNAFKPNTRGFYDVFGNAWEWTMDHFSPLDGFEVHRYYEDFSTPCFDGLHHIIQGSSYMSTGNEASIFSRYHFRPHFLQHASFRIVESSASVDQVLTSDTDAPGPYVGNYPFRQSKEGLEKSVSTHNNEHSNLNTVLSKHYGTYSQLYTNSIFKGYEDMSKMIQSLYTSHIRTPLQESNVCEVGCSVGGLTMSLHPVVKYMMCFDHDKAAIDTAEAIYTTRQVNYTLKDEGHLTQDIHVTLPSSPTTIMTDGRNNVEFRCADPMCLPAELHGFDLVIVNDILDTVSSPNSVLGRLGGARGLVKSGGMLVITSGFQWNERRTPMSLWLGGKKSTTSDSDNDNVTPIVKSVDTLQAKLRDEFTVVDSRDMQLVWKESCVDIRGKNLTMTTFIRK